MQRKPQKKRIPSGARRGIAFAPRTVRPATRTPDLRGAGRNKLPRR
jgi:hypothetical protein